MFAKQSAPRRAMRRLRWQVRSLAGRDLKPSIELHCKTDRCAGCDGGWTICPDLLNATSVVYSFGIGEDISFDRYIIDRFGTTVHAFDPTPRSLQWLAGQQLPGRFVVHEYGLAAYDGTAAFCPPEKEQHVDYTIVTRASTRHQAVPVAVRRLSSILAELGHNSIDLLKMDIEGAEYDVVEDILQSRIVVRQLLIEFHHRFPEIGVERTRTALAQLRSAGYRRFAISDSGQEYGFLWTSPC